MPPRPGTRRARPSTNNLGLHFRSPKRPRNKNYTQRVIKVPGLAARHQAHVERLDQLLDKTRRPPPASSQLVVSSDGSIEPHGPEAVDPETYSFQPLDDDNYSYEMAVDSENRSIPPVTTYSDPQTRRILPDATAERLYCNWRTILPKLVEPYLQYSSRMLGKRLDFLPDVMSCCTRLVCKRKSTQLLCLLFDHFVSLEVVSCECATLPRVLLHFGLFPSSPSQPRIAVSVELLAFYRALFERSCDSINALASALHMHYTRRGFQVANKAGQPILDPFRRSLGSAVQWYDVLLVEVQQQIESAVQRSRDCVKASLAISSPDSSSVTSELISKPSSTDQLPSSILVQRCPACFGGTKFGTRLEDGGDIHVATDGNFHHRHRRSAGNSPSFYEPSYFLSKEQVDAMGVRITKARKRPTKLYKQIVPDEAIDECESSYEAADGHKEKAATEAFDDTGLMALICRHDIPLFFANIDTAGEQQKFPLALIHHLFTLLPPQATVVVLYDVGCVLARTLSKYDILPVDTVQRLRFATTAMHAYGHEWACQLVFNPRLAVGLGLSDGEGTERLWSRMIKLIGVERSSSRHRRIWMIDRQAAAVGHEMRSDLGDWIKRRLRCGVQEQGDAARRQVDDSGMEPAELRAQWASQRSSQLSVRAHAPKRLKKQLDMVISLQADLDATDKALQAARSTIEKDEVCGEALDVLSGLERTHERLMSKVDGLYTSLNVQDAFPELEQVSFDFVRLLLLARDLKINIRKRAIGSFFEWDRLDQAVGGGQKPLGTKLHQQTRKAISKRQPALLSAIRKFNGYCMQLELLYDPKWLIPLPHALPTKLSELRNDQALMEDVWITPSTGTVPLWMEDKSVRLGIRGMLKVDRCNEEQRRLGLEADNLWRWYGEELTAIELALRTPGNEMFTLLLEQRRTHILSLQTRWANPLVSLLRFESRTKEARSLATTLAGGADILTLTWITPSTIEADLEVQEAGHAPPHVSAEEDLAEETTAAQAPPETPSEEYFNVPLADYFAEEAAEPEAEQEVNTDTPAVRIIWEIPRNLSVDPTPTPLEGNPLENNTPLVRKTRNPQDGFPPLGFEPEDIQLLLSPTACLNDICLNGCIALLFTNIRPTNADHFAFFSTYDLYRIRYNATDEFLWQTTRHTSFWTKSVWIIPIHRPGGGGHWVLCVVHVVRKELFLFDSLGEKRPWRTNVQEIMTLISRLHTLSLRHGVEFNLDKRFEWTAHPIVLQAVQTNGYDCGVWVLAMIASVLRGFDTTGLREKDIEAFRAYLCTMVLAL